MDRHELAWAAGFFDGEGWANAVAQAGRGTRQPHAQVNQSDREGIPAALERFHRSLYDGEGCSCLLDHRSHSGYKVPELSVTQSSADGQPEVLVGFRDVVNAGHIDGPIHQTEPWLPVYRWKSGALHDVRLVLDRIWPWLGPVKRAQAQTMLQVLDTQPLLPRGNPAWGNRKTHCVNGHEYAAARIGLYVPRRGGTQPRDSHQCLVCMRDSARERYKRKRTIDDGRG
jgi:hypothetical protein